MARIIIAEDEKDIRELIAFTLRFFGHLVLAYPNGREAWDQIRVDTPDLVILDVCMPVMTGHEVCENVKNDPSTAHIPVVFLSAKGQEDEIKTGLALGASDYLLKPFVPEELHKKVQEILLRNQVV